MQQSSSTADIIFRGLVVLVMFAVGAICISDADRVKTSFSFLGYCLASISQLWAFLHRCAKSTKHSRAYWLLCQISWTSNVIITIVFWGYLYHLEFIQKIIRGTAIRHTLMILMHFLPIIMEAREMYIRAIVYQKGDYKWTVVYLLVYGLVNIVDTMVNEMPLYPMLNWKDISSVVFIVLVLGLSYSTHCCGYYLSQKLHKVIDKAGIKGE